MSCCPCRLLPESVNKAYCTYLPVDSERTTAFWKSDEVSFKKSRAFKCCDHFIGVSNHRPVLSSYKYMFEFLDLGRTDIFRSCVCVCVYWRGSYYEGTYGVKLHVQIWKSGAVMETCPSLDFSFMISWSSHFTSFCCSLFSLVTN